MRVVIIAGGKGTRLGDLAKEIPKPMVKIAGKPILEHQIEFLKDYNFKDITLCIGHLANVITDYFKDGTDFGVNIDYFIEEEPLGTAGCVKKIKNRISSDFLVMYGDVLMNVDLNRLVNFHKAKNSSGTLVVHPNDHPHDSDLVEIFSDGRIKKFLNKPHGDIFYRNLANASLFVLSPKVIDYIPDNRCSFEKDVFPKMLDNDEILTAYNTPEYLKDVGTPERLLAVEKDIFSGKFSRLNLKNKRPAIFLDRDGVINELVDNLHRMEDFRLIPNSDDAIKLINSSEYLSVILTNQPMIAKGFMNFEDLELIHKKMETLLGKKGAKLDSIYFCPHHPHKGFDGEVPELKIDCDCRKPKIGMIKKAVEDLNIDLENSMIIGDSHFDILCGKNARIRTIGLRTGYGCKDCEVSPDFLFNDLYEAVVNILKVSKN